MAKDFFTQLNQGEAQKLYLLHGEEEYLKETALSAIKKKALSGGLPEMNETVLIASKADDIIAACETLPFMSEKRLIIVKDSPLLQTGRESGGEDGRLVSYLQNIPSTCCLVFYQKGVANKTRKLYKAIDKLGTVYEFVTPDERLLVKWIAKQLNGYQKIITDENARRLIFISGKDMLTLRNEISKLAAYAGKEREVTAEAIESVVIPSLEYRVFDLSDAVVRGDGKKAEELMQDMLYSGESRLGLLALLTRQARQMLIARLLLDRGEERAVAQSLGIRDYGARRLLQSVRNRSADTCKKAYCACIDTEFSVKSGLMQEEGALEKTVYELLELK
ncbi:MAG: DNA polymerase III subunit delta [Christensenellales bacterium]